MKHITYLISGIVFTVLFFILSCSDGFNIWEQMFFNQGYNDKMYNLNMYPVIAAITIAVAWGAAAIYYYAINSVSFARWYHWLIFLGIAVLFAPTVDFVYPNSVFGEYDYDFTVQLIHFSLLNIVVEAVLYIIASFSIRWWSSNCRHTPIPQ